MILVSEDTLKHIEKLIGVGCRYPNLGALLAEAENLNIFNMQKTTTFQYVSGIPVRVLLAIKTWIKTLSGAQVCKLIRKDSKTFQVFSYAEVPMSTAPGKVLRENTKAAVLKVLTKAYADKDMSYIQGQMADDLVTATLTEFKAYLANHLEL